MPLPDWKGPSFSKEGELLLIGHGPVFFSCVGPHRRKLSKKSLEISPIAFWVLGEPGSGGWWRRMWGQGLEHRFWKATFRLWQQPEPRLGHVSTS